MSKEPIRSSLDKDKQTYFLACHGDEMHLVIVAVDSDAERTVPHVIVVSQIGRCEPQTGWSILFSGYQIGSTVTLLSWKFKQTI